MNISDEKLVKDFLSGDVKALEELVERYLKPIYNFIHQMVQDRDVAEDITQDVFLRMWKHMESFDAQKKFSTWLYAIAKNATLDWFKKKKNIPFSSFLLEDGSSPLENIVDEKVYFGDKLLGIIDDKSEAWKMIRMLKAQEKTIFLLHHVQGFSLVEIAEIFQESPNTLKSKYRRAIFQIRGNLGFSKKSFAVETNAPGDYSAS
jgi:RNA polymerase sigma-70 factor (ECF subfamily)